MHMEDQMERFVTTVEAARRLCLSRFRIWQFIRQGRLKAMRVGTLWLIDESELQRFAQLPRHKGRPKYRVNP